MTKLNQNEIIGESRDRNFPVWLIKNESQSKFLQTCAINRGSIILSTCSRTWAPVDSIACTGIARNAKGISMLTWMPHQNTNKIFKSLPITLKMSYHYWKWSVWNHYLDNSIWGQLSHQGVALAALTWYFVHHRSCIPISNQCQSIPETSIIQMTQKKVSLRDFSCPILHHTK